MIQLTQKELKQHVNNGEGFILNFRTVYQIDWSHGTQSYVQRKIHYSRGGLPLTGRGRFIFATRETTEKLCGFNKPINL